MLMVQWLTMTSCLIPCMCCQACFASYPSTVRFAGKLDLNLINCFLSFNNTDCRQALYSTAMFIKFLSCLFNAHGSLTSLEKMFHPSVLLLTSAHYKGKQVQRILLTNISLLPFIFLYSVNKHSSLYIKMLKSESRHSTVFKCL